MNNKTNTLITRGSVVFFFLLMSFASFSVAIPGVISYQGVLKNNSGQPITTPVDVIFTFWDAETGGAQIGAFSDTDSITPSSNGTFATAIGDEPGNPIPAAIFATDSVWLNISIGGTSLAPRTRMIAVPYAVQSAHASSADSAATAASATDADTATNADMVDNKHAADFADAQHGHNLQDLGGEVTDIQVPDDITVNHAQTADNAMNANDADTVDSKHAADFADALHSHNLQDLGGAVTDAQIPAAITRDAEMSAALAAKADSLHTHDKNQLNNAGTLGFAWSDAEVANNLTIHSGVIDNSSIGATLPTTGYFTHLGANSNVVLGDAGTDQITVNGALKIASGSPGLNKVLTSDAAGNATWQISNPHYQNIIVVAKTGGDFDTISGALASITDAADSKRYLIYVAPGVYNERVTMKPYIDIEGSGEHTTKITYTGGTAVHEATLIGASNAEIRFLTVENTGSNNAAYAMYNNNASPTIRYLNIISSNGTNLTGGIYNSNSSLIMQNVTITVTGTNCNCIGLYGVVSTTIKMDNGAIDVSGDTKGVYAVFADAGANISIRNANISASGINCNTYAVYNAYNITLFNVIVTAQGSGTGTVSGIYGGKLTMNNVISSASGGDTSFGVYSGTYVTMDNVIASAKDSSTESVGISFYWSLPSIPFNHVTAIASGSSPINTGLKNTKSSLIFRNSYFEGTSAGNGYGINNSADSGSYTVQLDNCQIVGSTHSISSDNEFTVRVGGSLLSGGPVAANGGSCKCAGVYDENYDFFPNTCP